jgi:hypothetical protein
MVTPCRTEEFSMARFRVLAMFIAAMFATAPGQGRDNFPNHDNEDRVASPARQRV